MRTRVERQNMRKRASKFRRADGFRVRLGTQIIALLSAFGFLSITAWRLTLSENVTPQEWIIFGTFAAFVVGDRLNTIVALVGEREREEIFRRAHDEIMNISLRNTGVTLLGTPSDGLRRMMRAMETDGLNLRDCIFRVTANASYRHTDDYRKYLGVLDKFIQNNGRYIAVGNPAGLADSDPHARLSAPNFSVFVAEIAIPVVNFVIIEYSGGAKEVLFGWDYDNIQLGHVFITRNTDLVVYFELLFASLTAKSTPMSRPPSSRPTPPASTAAG